MGCDWVILLTLSPLLLELTVYRTGGVFGHPPPLHMDCQGGIQQGPTSPPPGPPAGRADVSSLHGAGGRCGAATVTGTERTREGREGTGPVCMSVYECRCVLM